MDDAGTVEKTDVDQLLKEPSDAEANTRTRMDDYEVEENRVEPGIGERVSGRESASGGQSGIADKASEDAGEAADRSAESGDAVAKDRLPSPARKRSTEDQAAELAAVSALESPALNLQTTRMVEMSDLDSAAAIAQLQALLRNAPSTYPF